MKTSYLLAAILLFAGACVAMEPAERVTATFTDPSRPGRLKVNLLNGSITVKAYDGKEVVIESTSHEGRAPTRENPAARGMKRIPMSSAGVNVEEENNEMRVSTGAMNVNTDLVIQVPRKTSLNLKTVNGGQLEVSGVDGEIDVNNVNGAITLDQVAGTVLAHALNGKLKVTMTRVDNKPMAFSSMNGEIDVTLPANVRASVSLSDEMGEIYSDFDIATQSNAPKVTTEDSRAKGGKYRLKVDRTVRGMINGGGPEMQFKNFNGNIYIRRAGAAQ